MNAATIEEQIRNVGLRVTPQRILVLNTFTDSSHPNAEQIIEKVRKKQPSISSSTIYHILDAFVDKGLIKKVYTAGEPTCYDAILEKHHHLHDIETNHIEDYFDDDLFAVIEKYLKKKNIPGFELTDIQIKLMGKLNQKTNSNEH